MGDTNSSSGSDRVLRLFPLSQVVLLPHALLPLHIFEPRYRQMTEDALVSGDNLITMVQLCEDETRDGLGDPPIERIACLGKIVQHHRLADGRFHLLLLGLKRVRVLREVPSEKLYRLAETENLDDVKENDQDDRLRAELLALYRRVAERIQEWDPELPAALDAELPLGSLTDLIAQGMNLPPSIKQELLAELRPDHRAARLLQILARRESEDVDGPPRSRSFPPPFSNN